MVLLLMCCGLSSGVHLTVRLCLWRLATAGPRGASSSCSWTVVSMPPVTTRLLPEHGRKRTPKMLAVCSVRSIAGPLSASGKRQMHTCGKQDMPLFSRALRDKQTSRLWMLNRPHVLLSRSQSVPCGHLRPRQGGSPPGSSTLGSRIPRGPPAPGVRIACAQRLRCRTTGSPARAAWPEVRLSARKTGLTWPKHR